MKNVVQILKRCLALFSPDARKRLYFLAFAVAAMSVVELFGVVSILPFMSVATNPEMIQTNSYLKMVYDYFQFQNENQFLIFLGIFAFLFLVLGNAVRALSSYLLIRFAQMQDHHLSSRVLESYLSQPYEYFLSKNSSDLSRVALTEVTQVINQIIQPMLKAGARMFTAVLIVTFIVLVNPVVAVVMSGVLFGAYIIIYKILKERITLFGRQKVTANQHRFRVVNEAAGGIKEVKLLNKESVYLKDYKKASLKYAQAQNFSIVSGELPRYFLEVVAFGGILGIVIFLISTQGQSQAISLAAVYAFAGYKLLPALQEIFNSINKIRFSLPVLPLLEDSFSFQAASGVGAKDSLPLSFDKNLELKDISFQYANSDKRTLESVSFKIEANTTVGVVGPTGSGKTTMIDLILGLLKPTSGELRIDGVLLNDQNRIQWQKNIGYVPQFIYLSDDTIEANIAFGIPAHQVSKELVKRAAVLSQIDDFIETQLPMGYQTKVGERGVRLSGGQRQRIGIARALYHDPKLIVFDEATSALDSETEKALMESIERLSGKKTIIMIAHRLSTLQTCNQIIEINAGVAQLVSPSVSMNEFVEEAK